MKNKYNLFWDGPFSQWASSPFRNEYGNFNCAEQYMMYRKALLFNDFEYSIFTQFPELAEIKSQLYTQGAFFAGMSGSGSTMFGLFLDTTTAHKAKSTFLTYQCMIAPFT